MKQLSIEQKAKAYDEALKVLHKYDGANIMFTQDLKEEMFPELAESDDERVRKRIIALVRAHGQGMYKDEMLAWLEKQGEQKQEETWPNLSNCLHDCKKCAGKCLYRKEKYQSEQKPAELTDLRTWKYIIDAVLTEREGIGNYLDNPWTTEVAEKLQKRFGNIEKNPVYPLAHEHEKMETERWKEACKAACSDMNYRSHYGLTETRDDYFVDGVHWADEHPKQKTWNEEDEKMLKRVIDFIPQCMTAHGYNEYINFLKSLKDRVQPRQEWSEEDDDMLNTIIADYKFLSKKYRDAERDFFITMQITGDDIEAVSWLESLKNRVLSQSKKEWNKNDERNINDIISIIYENCIAEDASRLIQWILSLRPQQKYEWNDEDKKILENVINDIKSLKQQVYCKSACDKEIDWLKSLRPQSHWKPSESDILLLERIANGKSNPQDFQASLGGLIGQLKKLREE